MKLGVFSSASDIISPENQALAAQIGKYLADKKITVVSGGSHGIPGLIVQAAFDAGADTELYSPDEDEEKHQKRSDNLELRYFKTHKFIPGFTARSLEMIKNIDAALVLNGRTGTLSEFTIALEEGLPVAVVKNTGGIADHLENIISIANKEFPHQIIFEEDFRVAVDKLAAAAHGAGLP